LARIGSPDLTATCETDQAGRPCGPSLSPCWLAPLGPARARGSGPRGPGEVHTSNGEPLGVVASGRHRVKRFDCSFHHARGSILHGSSSREVISQDSNSGDGRPNDSKPQEEAGECLSPGRSRAEGTCQPAFSRSLNRQSKAPKPTNTRPPAGNQMAGPSRVTSYTTR